MVTSGVELIAVYGICWCSCISWTFVGWTCSFVECLFILVSHCVTDVRHMEMVCFFCCTCRRLIRVWILGTMQAGGRLYFPIRKIDEQRPELAAAVGICCRRSLSFHVPCLTTNHRIYSTPSITRPHRRSQRQSRNPTISVLIFDMAGSLYIGYRCDRYRSLY